MKKKRMVVGPPPIKYLKKYASGGELNYDSQGNIIRNKTYSTKDEMPVVSSKKTYGKDVSSLGDSVGLGKTNYNVNVPKKSGTPSYSGNSFGEAFAKARKELGANKVFTYNGKLFTTNYADTATKKSVDPSIKKGGPVDGSSVVGRMKNNTNSQKYNSGGRRSIDFIPGDSNDTYGAFVNKTTSPRAATVVEKKPAIKPNSNVANKPVTTASTKPEPARRDTILKANEDDKWIRTIMEFEASKGSAQGTGLSNFGFNNSRTPPRNIDEAVELYKQQYLPKVKNIEPGLRERFGDFLYNSGENLWLYMIHQNRIDSGNKEGVKNRSEYRSKNGPRYNFIEQDFKSDIENIQKLPLKKQIELADKARDWYYQNINRVDNKPSSAYEKSWKDRVNMFNENKEFKYGGMLPKKADGGTLNTAANITSSLGGLASMIPGIGGVIGSVVSGIATPIMKSIAQGQAQRSNTNKMYSSTQMLEKGGMIKKKIDKYAYGGNVYQPTIWGYPVYKSPENFSKEKSFNSAFEKARGKNLDKFLYNGKTYNTRKDTDDIKLTPEVIKMYGDVNKILNKEYPELKKLLNRGTPVNKLQYIKDRASWLPSGINVGKTRLGKDEDPTSMLNIFNLPAELAHHEQFTNLPIGKRILKFASGIKERFKYGDPGMYYKKGTIENEAHSQWEPAIELTARGNLTPEYIKQVQRKLGFTGKDVDGILGPKTYGKLVSAAGLSKKVLDNPEGRGDMEEGTDVLPKILKTMQNMVDMGSLQKTTSNETFIPKKEKGGLIKRKDGSYSKRGLWDNIRANKGSGRKPTSEMLKQERKIRKMSAGGTLSGRDDLTMYKGRLHRDGGIMVSSKGTPTKNNPAAEVEHNETRFSKGDSVYVFSDKLLI